MASQRPPSLTNAHSHQQKRNTSVRFIFLLPPGASLRAAVHETTISAPATNPVVRIEVRSREDHLSVPLKARQNTSAPPPAPAVVSPLQALSARHPGGLLRPAARAKLQGRRSSLPASTRPLSGRRCAHARGPRAHAASPSPPLQ